MVIAQSLNLKVALLLSSLMLASPCFARGVSPDAQSKGLAHYIMALCYDEDGQSAKAISEYQQSIKFDGQEALSRLKLGDYYLRLGDLDKAQEQFKIVARLNPNETKAHYLLALVDSSQQRYDLAASEYELVLKAASANDPANMDVYLSLGQLYYAQGKYPQAIEQFSKIIAIDPNNANAFYLLGSVYADNNDHPKAIENFRHVLQLDAGNSDGLNSLGYVYAQDGIHLDEAIAMINKAVAIDPTNGAYYDSLGWALYKKGLYAQSLIALQKSLTLTQDEILYDHLGDVYKALKEYSQALEYWQKSLDKDPHQRDVQQKISAMGGSALSGNGLKKCTASQSFHQLN